MSKFRSFIKLLKSKTKSISKQPKDLIKTSKSLFDFRGVFNFRPLDNKNPVRKEEFVLRLLALTTGGLFCIVILLTLVIKTLIPLHKVEPMFLSVASEDKQIYWVEPLQKKTKAFRVVTESLIHQYIEARESIDGQTEAERYEFVKWVSGSNVFAEFQEEFGNKNHSLDNPWGRATTFNLSRGVKIIVVDFLNDNQLQADFNIFEYKRATGQIVSKASVRATITIKYEPNRVTAKDKYMNPLGLTITDYSLSTKDLKEFVILRNTKNEKI